MAENDLFSLFGFEIVRKKKEEKEETKKVSFVPTNDEQHDGGYVVDAGGHFGSYVDMEGSRAGNERDLIYRYREVANQTECDAAIEDLVNEAIVTDENVVPVNLILDKLDQPDRIKKLIHKEFEGILSLLNINWLATDIFRRWYIDGRIYFHKIIDEKNPQKGIIEVRPIDATKMRKVKELIKDRDPKTGAEIITGANEFYIFEKGGIGGSGASTTGLKIAKDSICYVTSGLLDPTKTQVWSYLHKAMKPVNQLRMMEDSLVIYRHSRAPERRIFYIDVGNLPKGKAEEYLNNIMSRYRNKMVYDANTGELKDDRKHMSMLEDFWLPRREGGRGTEITTLPGGDNLGQIEDILYFQKKLYKSLNVPVSRLDSEQQAMVSLGRATETTREELKFSKFVSKLRKKFSMIFIDLLRTQLILKGIVTNDEWNDIRQEINIDFIKDSYFSELKNAEILRERIMTLREVDDYVGRYYSAEWVRKNILMQTEEDIEEIIDQINTEKSAVDDDGADDLDLESTIIAPETEIKEEEVLPIESVEEETVINEETKKEQLKLVKAMTTFLEE